MSTAESCMTSSLDRLFLGFFALFLATLLGVAAFLEPSPTGFGTHQKLGLPPCTFQWLLGIRCPACGMTTSWSHLMHGHLIASLQANSAGCLLGMLALWATPMLLYKSWTGIEFQSGWFGKSTLVMLCVCLGVAVVEWLIRILT